MLGTFLFGEALFGQQGYSAYLGLRIFELASITSAISQTMALTSFVDLGPQELTSAVSFETELSSTVHTASEYGPK